MSFRIAERQCRPMYGIQGVGVSAVKDGSSASSTGDAPAPARGGDVLSDYPAAWVRSAETTDKAHYRIRPIRSDDSQRELDFISALSPESRYNRVMCARGTPSGADLEQLVHVDYRNRMAFIAVIDVGGAERIVGAARYAVDGDRRCEFAVAVADDWQHRGVGIALCRGLLDYARTRGIEEIHATTLATNHQMIALARALGMQVQADLADSRIVCASLAHLGSD